MKIIIMLFSLLSTTVFAKELGFTCWAQHRTKPVDKIFFNIILDTNSYNKKTKAIDIFVYQQSTVDMTYDFIEAEAFYVSDSETNPQYYIKATEIPYFQHQLDFIVYPLAEKMFGYTNMTIKKNGVVMDGTCERADYLDLSV